MTPASRKLPLVTGLRLQVLEWDSAAAPARDHTVILVHGFLDFAWTWQQLVESGLAGRFHVVAPDLRGHGDSDRVGAGGYYHYADYLADLADLVDQVGREKVSIVGHSMGGSIAAYYAGTHPERVHRLALLEGLGPPETTPIGPERVAAWISAWKRVATAGTPRALATVDEAAERLLRHDPLLEPALARWLAERGTVVGPEGVRFKHDPLHVTPGPFGFQVEMAERFWRRIACPTLIVRGAKSEFRHTDAELARRVGAFRNARSVVLEGAAHMMQRHQPAALAVMLREFLVEEGGQDG